MSAAIDMIASAGALQLAPHFIDNGEETRQIHEIGAIVKTLRRQWSEPSLIK